MQREPILSLDLAYAPYVVLELILQMVLLAAPHVLQERMQLKALKAARYALRDHFRYPVLDHVRHVVPVNFHWKALEHVLIVLQDIIRVSVVLLRVLSVLQEHLLYRDHRLAPLVWLVNTRWQVPRHVPLVPQEPTQRLDLEPALNVTRALFQALRDSLLAPVVLQERIHYQELIHALVVPPESIPEQGLLHAMIVLPESFQALSALPLVLVALPELMHLQGPSRVPYVLQELTRYREQALVPHVIQVHLQQKDQYHVQAVNLASTLLMVPDRVLTVRPEQLLLLKDHRHVLFVRPEPTLWKASLLALPVQQERSLRRPVQGHALIVQQGNIH